MKDLLDATVGRSPCQVFKCRSFDACAKGPRACASFREWVNGGTLRPTRDDPTKAMFREIYTREEV